MTKKWILVLGVFALFETGQGEREESIEPMPKLQDLSPQPRRGVDTGRVGASMSPEERESCDKLALREIKKGVYYGDLRLRWRAASECCEINGKSLLTFTERHIAAIQPFTPAQSDDFLNMPWVGGHDYFREGMFQWVTGKRIPSTRPPFRFYYGNPNQNCVEVEREGLLIDINCDHKLNFLCEDVPAHGTKPTAKDLEVCNTMEFEGGSRFKKYKGSFDEELVNWPLAKARCELRDRKLASLSHLSAADERDLAELIKTYSYPYWISGRGDVPSQSFIWDTEDDAIPTDSSLWEPDNPQSIFRHGRCVIVHARNGKLSIYDNPCDSPAFALCEDDPGCVARDSVKIISKPGRNQFEFRSSATLADKKEMGRSLARHLSPSKLTGLDWKAVWETYFLLPDGDGPVEFDPKDLATPEQNSACIASFFAYKEYVATCNKTTVAYIKPFVVTAENVSDLCATLVDCVACTACDCWVLVATHNTLDVDPSLASRARDDVAPKLCFDFQPPLDYNDFTNALLTKEFVTALNPSPTTGVDWSEYYGNVTSGIQAERYVVRKGDVPAGSFMNIYKVKGTCGDYTTMLPVFKKVLFKTGDSEGNCEIARNENVPLAGC